MFAPLRADVAQLVEQRFRKPQVTGSNPVVGCLDCGIADCGLPDFDIEYWMPAAP